MYIQPHLLCDLETLELSRYPHVIVKKPDVAILRDLYRRLGGFGPWPFKPEATLCGEDALFQSWSLPENKEQLFNIAIGGNNYDALIRLNISEEIIMNYFGGSVSSTTINTPWLNAPRFLDEVDNWIGIPSQGSVFIGFFTRDDADLINYIKKISHNNMLLTYMLRT